MFVETNCVVEHEGRKFEAGGAVITDDYIVAYPGKHGELNDWHGNKIGTYRIVSSWRIHSYLSDRMFQIESVVNGIAYTGRGMGINMLYRGKRKRSK